jgi:hypothetical protein
MKKTRNKSNSWKYLLCVVEEWSDEWRSGGKDPPLIFVLNHLVLLK